MLVSVIVPNYNHEKYLRQRLESIFNQTYVNFEVILLDDCSMDNSRKILSSYKNHPKVSHCVFDDINSGNTFSQWSRGISLAKGDIIWIAESDDFCELNFLEVLLQPLLRDKEVVLSYCQSTRVNEDGLITGNWLDYTNSLDAQLFLKNFILDGNEFIERFLIYKNVIPNASAVLFRREEVINKIGNKLNTNPILKYCGDWLFYFQMIVNKKVSYHAGQLNNFRYHSKSAIAIGGKIENRISFIDFDFAMKLEVMSFIKKAKPYNFKAIASNNKKIKKELIYEKALFFIRNNKKIKGYVLLLSVLDVFFVKYKIKKNLQIKMNNFFNLKNE